MILLMEEFQSQTSVRSDRGLWTSQTLSLTSATVAIGRLVSTPLQFSYFKGCATFLFLWTIKN